MVLVLKIDFAKCKGPQLHRLPKKCSCVLKSWRKIRTLMLEAGLLADYFNRLEVTNVLLSLHYHSNFKVRYTVVLIWCFSFYGSVRVIVHVWMYADRHERCGTLTFFHPDAIIQSDIKQKQFIIRVRLQKLEWKRERENFIYIYFL